jgi:hypothetical protein
VAAVKHLSLLTCVSEEPNSLNSIYKRSDPRVFLPQHLFPSFPLNLATETKLETQRPQTKYLKFAGSGRQLGHVATAQWNMNIALMATPLGADISAGAMIT